VKNDISNEMDLEEAQKLKQSLMQQVSELEKDVQSAQLTLEQQVLQAHYRQPPPAASADLPSPSDPPQKPQ
ncbi:MAG: hypothetical protein Q7T59_05235, partial [Candidatus Woesebacteria bacterium]|nr:hypothetical protein [Candidatus Woesebacteria bacterium]